MNTANHMHHTIETIPWMMLSVLAVALYGAAVVLTNRKYKTWPVHRTICWVLGVISVSIAITPPLAHKAHLNFTTHMLVHALLGMLAPLLIALSAPMTLVFRTIPVSTARQLAKLLKSWPSQILTHPIVASFLNIGGLWFLYTTNLYSLIHQSNLLHFIVHLHLFLAGYLFTIAMIYIDPIFHRHSFFYRAIVFVIALAGHDILAKVVYAHPPVGVPTEQAEAGTMLMYYGGDLIDITIASILCWHWFQATRPRVSEVISIKVDRV